MAGGLGVVLRVPGGSDGKELTCKEPAADAGSIPGLGRSPGGGNVNPLQYSCLENPMDRGVWWATVHGVRKKVGHNLVTKQQIYTYTRVKRDISH